MCTPICTASWQSLSVSVSVFAYNSRHLRKRACDGKYSAGTYTKVLYANTIRYNTIGYAARYVYSAARATMRALVRVLAYWMNFWGHACFACIVCLLYMSVKKLSKCVVVVVADDAVTKKERVFVPCRVVVSYAIECNSRRVRNYFASSGCCVVFFFVCVNLIFDSRLNNHRRRMFEFGVYVGFFFWGARWRRQWAPIRLRRENTLEIRRWALPKSDHPSSEPWPLIRDEQQQPQTQNGTFT